MFIEAVKQYINESKDKIKIKFNPKYFHVALILLSHFAACAFLPFWLFIPWTILFLIFIPRFIGWYLIEFKQKK